MGLDVDALVPLVDEGLGNSAYLLDLGGGRGFAVDPPRDLRSMRAAAAARGLTIAYAADTHLHADFLSGARQLAATDGATIVAPAAGLRQFPHRGLGDGDEVALGGLTLRALTTPGHTDEHMSYLLLDGASPVGVFSGGSLIVGAAARTDLLGADRAEELAHAQYASLQRLAQLPGDTRVWPTHGAGSFCSAPPSAQRTSTIAEQRLTNPLLAAPDPASFARALIGSLGSYPNYFGWLAECNRQGPAIVEGEPALSPLDPDEVASWMAQGATVIDVRPSRDAAAGHIPGAIAIMLRGQFATWLGWLVGPQEPLVVVRNPDQHPGDILWPALNIGYERFIGELAGGMAAWADSGQAVQRVALVRPAEVGDPVRERLLDVRQDDEYQQGHVRGATHVELGRLPALAPTLDAQPTLLMCAHGERSMTAATILQRGGNRNVAVLAGGATGWVRAGRPLER